MEINISLKSVRETMVLSGQVRPSYFDMFDKEIKLCLIYVIYMCIKCVGTWNSAYGAHYSLVTGSGQVGLHLMTWRFTTSVGAQGACRAL